MVRQDFLGLEFSLSRHQHAQTQEKSPLQSYCGQEKSKEMALTCNVERLRRVHESWSLASRSEPSRVEAESTQACCKSVRNAAQARVACRSRQTRAAETKYFRRRVPGYFLGISRYV